MALKALLTILRVLCHRLNDDEAVDDFNLWVVETLAQASKMPYEIRKSSPQGEVVEAKKEDTEAPERGVHVHSFILAVSHLR